MILPPTPELVEVEQAKVLIADDVADTGHTLALVKEFCTGRWPRSGVPCSTRSPVRRAVRVRLAAHGAVDQLPVERQGPHRRAARDGRHQGRPRITRRAVAARTPDAGTGKGGRPVR